MTGPAVETASTRWRQLVFRHACFQLRLNDLLGNIAADLNQSFVIDLSRFGDS